MTETARRDATLIAPLTTTRFVAALLVVFYHSGASWVVSHPQASGVLSTLLLNCYVAVTYFFTLSGFILHFTYRGGVSGAAAWKRYAVARVARIYPVYVLAVLAMLPFVPLRGWSDLPQFALVQWWVPGHVFHLRNWNMPAWTLSVEAFFYLCFPLLSRTAAKIGSHWLWAIIVACGAFLLISGSAAITDNRDAMLSWMLLVPLPLLRLPEFVIGICASELHLRREGQAFPVASWLLVVLLVGGLCVSRAQWVAGFASLMSAALIVSLAANGGSRLARFLSLRPLVLLGGASYAFYLFHQPVHFAIERLLGGSKPALAAQYPVLLIVAVAIFLYVEEPARESIRRRLGMKPSVIEPVAAHPVG